MPTISLRDDLDLDIEVEPNDTSAFVKYFKVIPELITRNRKLRDFAPLKLDDPAVTSFQSSLSFGQPVPIGVQDIDLTIKAGANGAINIFLPDPHLGKDETDSLFSPDKYGEDVPVKQSERYVSFNVTANVGGSVATRASDLTFGFSADSSVSVTNYQKFSITPTAPTILSAIKQTLASFQLPGDLQDLEAMLPDSVITVAGNGSLKFSASANLLAVSNPLASVDALSWPGPISVSEGASITVGGSYRVFGDYEIRIRKTGPTTVRLGYFREHGSEWKVNTSASAGLSLSLGDDDLFAKVISALSPDAQADFDELKNAKLDPDTIASIQATVMAAIERTLEVAVSFEIGSLAATQAAFLYEVDLAALAADGRMAIHRALDGDLSDLVSQQGPLPGGIKMVQSVFTTLTQSKHTFKVNLLGIYNFISISKLTLKGKALFDPESGELTLSDTASASRIQATVLNIGGKPTQADPRQLRKVLASSLLITAAYRASGSTVSQPKLKSSQIHCELHAQTNRETMQDELDVAVGLKLMTMAEQNDLTKEIGDFGRTIVYATTDYDDALMTTMFLEGEMPRAITDYETIGRQAMQVAIHNDAVDRFRLSPLQDDGVWKEMKDGGQPKFRQIFPAATNTQIGAMTADYTTIVWWAKTMNETGKKLAVVRAFLAQNPKMDPENNTFKKLRGDLAEHLKSVAADTREEFGRPWGLIAMDMLTGFRSNASVSFTGPVVSFAKQRAIAMTAAANP